MSKQKQVTSYSHRQSAEEQEPDPQPGDYFVSIRSGSRHALLSGPYETHAAALADVAACRETALWADDRADFYSFGTCRLPLNSGRQGALQKRNLHTIGKQNAE